MNDAISIDQDDDDDAGAVSVATAPAGPRLPHGVGARFTGWMRQRAGTARATAGAARKLAALYFSQTGLIFPARDTQGRPHAILQAPPKTDDGAELVALRTACGQSISGLFGPALSHDGRPLPDARTRATMLFFYGNGQYLAKANVAHLFDGLRRMGVNVMVPEYVGYGMSTGDACEAGCYATADAAWRHLQSRPDVDPGKVIAAGASLGGAVAIDLASRERAVAGLITLITFTSMPDMARVVQPALPIWRFIRHKFESERKMSHVACPSLIIHSTGDALVPYAMADRLAAACTGPVSRVKIEGAGHSSVEMLEGGRGQIYDAITAFLTRL